MRALGVIGLFCGVVTIHTAWNLTFPLSHWQHGFFMIALSFAAAGLGAGYELGLRDKK